MSSGFTKKIRIEPAFFGGPDNYGMQFENRLAALEKKMDLLVSTCSAIYSTCEKLMLKEKSEHDCCANLLLQKIVQIDQYIKNFRSFDMEAAPEPEGSCNPILLVPSGNPQSPDNLDSSVQILTSNSEEDIPHGSWLGDPLNPKARVRVDISPSSLMHINTHCLTPEKMALTLLDCLFPLDVLAVSNLSGKGKHSKKQLNPLLIYGIRCHLVYKFNITDKDWHRLKQNIDSKCRAAWRKKMSGFPVESETSKEKKPLNEITPDFMERDESYWASLLLGSSQPNFSNEHLSDDSSDGISNSTFCSEKIIRKNNKNNTLISLDNENVKAYANEELKELIQGPSELFSESEEADGGCFSDDMILCGNRQSRVLGVVDDDSSDIPLRLN